MALPKAGRYELLEELGRGAMGVVYKAFDPMIRRPVAVKTMRLNEEGSGMVRPELIARFQTEARAAGVLTHPNIVTVYDAGETDGLFYITMEYVEGRSLQALMDLKQVFPLPRIIKILEQACTALDFAHQHNVVHRDVKPANLMMTPDEVVKVSDFGTAKIMQLGTTQTGSIIGTPSYMSPEQVKGKIVDGRSDIFALGVILYELVTGEKPFPGQNVTTVIYKVVHEDPIPPRDLDASIHPGLSAVISKALAKDPDARFQDCREMATALKHYREMEAASLNATVVMMSRPRLPTLPQTGKTMAAPPAAETAAQPSASLTPEAPQAAAPPRPPAPRPHAQTLPDLPEDAVPPAQRSHALLMMFLGAIIAAGGYLIWPTFRDALGIGKESPSATAPLPATGAAAPARGAAPPVTAAPRESSSAVPPPTSAPVAATRKSTAPAPASDVENLMAKVEQRLAQAGLAGKIRAGVEGQSVTLTGSLTRQERRQLLMRLRGLQLPAGFRLQDRTQLAGAAAPGAPAQGDEEGNLRPRTSAGMGEIEIFADVTGARATLKGPRGDAGQECSPPCRFEDLAPGRYTLQITRDGYRPVNRIVAVRAGNISQEKIRFQAETSGVQITSRPARAEVLINGKPHAEPTPTTVYLAPGSYSIVVQKPGFSKYEGAVQLRADELHQINVQLIESARGVGWVDVRTVPPGADILIDDTSSGRRSPFRLELRAGQYTLTLYFKGYQAVRRTVVVEENQTVQINEPLVRP